MRRWASALLVVGIVAGLVGVGAPASAVEPVPPVTPLPAIPAQLAKSVTGSPIADNVLLLMKAMVNAGGAAAPKAITAPTVLSRVAGGTALVGAQLSWAVSSDGTLAAIAMATGSTYENVYCQQPHWYQTANAFVNLSIAPDCQGLIDQAVRNNDQVETLTADWTDAYGNSVVVHRAFMGQLSFSNTTPVRSYCGTLTYAPSGWTGGWDGTTPGASSNVTQFYSTVGNCPGAGLTTLRNYLSPYVMHNYRFTGPGGITSTFNAAQEIESSRADPLRTPNCKVTGGGETFNALGTPYRESDGIPLSAEGTGCKKAFEDFVSSPGRGPGFLPEKIEVDSTDEGGAITEISDSPVPELMPDEKKGLTPGDNKGLILSRIVGTTVNSCMTWLEDCKGWWEASENGTREDLYRCMFNGQQIALALCSSYKYTFDVQTSTPRITDPQSGEQVDWVAGTGGAPGGSVNPGAGIDPSGECFADGWASVANPIEWVLLPVKCALVWAFVPRSEVVTTAQTGFQAKIDNTVIGSIAGGLTTLGAAFDAGVGCAGLPFHLEGFGVTLVHANLLASCEEPAAGIAATVKTILIGVIIFGAFLAVLRYLAATFGFVAFGGGREGVAGNDSGPRFS